MNYTATIQGGEGPDVWEYTHKIFAADIIDAARQAKGVAAERFGQVVIIELDCIQT